MMIAKQYFLGHRFDPPNRPPLKCESGKTRKKSKSAKGKGENTNSPTYYYYEFCVPTKVPSNVKTPTSSPLQNPSVCNPALSLDCDRPVNDGPVNTIPTANPVNTIPTANAAISKPKPRAPADNCNADLDCDRATNPTD